jgi:hypothetical protein
MEMGRKFLTEQSRIAAKNGNGLAASLTEIELLAERMGVSPDDIDYYDDSDFDGLE